MDEVRHPMTNQQETQPLWWLAGLAVRCNRELDECPRIVQRDFDLDLVIRDESEHGITHEAVAVDDSEWVHLPVEGQVQARVRIDGRLAVAEGIGGVSIDPSYQARRVVPFAAALQGLVVLHAGAVASAEMVYAIVGESGVGKSTLVDALANSGFAAVADDLLPCRVEAGRVTVPTSVSLPTSGTLTLSGLYFLERDPDIPQPERHRLGSVEVVRELVRHGFGEVNAPRIWAVQFESYGRIAELCAGFRLVVPEDRSHRGDVARLVAERMFMSEQADSEALEP